MLLGKKVLIVHSSAGLYGADRCLLWIAEGLTERGMAVEAVLPFTGILESELQKIGVPVHLIEPIVFRRSVMNPVGLAKLAANSAASLSKMRNLIRRGNFDLVHSNTGVVIGGAIAARLCGKPHIWHFREILNEFKQIWKLHEPLVNLTSAEVVCISKAVAEQFKSTNLKAKATVVYDGVPIPGQDSAKNARFPQGSIRLLTVGLLAPYKGQDVLIRTVKTLVDEGLDVELTIVGDVFGGQVKYRDALVDMVAEMGLVKKVKFEGFCEDVEPYFEKSDVFILPSGRPEGLGLVVLEAMAHRMPVIATEGGGVNEIISDGENGILVESGNHLAIVAAVKKLAAENEFAKSLSDKGYMTVVERFALEHMIENLTRIYRRALA